MSNLVNRVILFALAGRIAIRVGACGLLRPTPQSKVSLFGLVGFVAVYDWVARVGQPALAISCGCFCVQSDGEPPGVVQVNGYRVAGVCGKPRTPGCWQTDEVRLSESRTEVSDPLNPDPSGPRTPGCWQTDEVRLSEPRT